MTTQTTIGSGTVAALEAAWADIRANHPDVLEHVVIRIGSGRSGKRLAGSLTLGSISLDQRWAENRLESSRAKDETRQRFHEIFIAGETLAQHPVKLLETLIHEAAHSVSITRGVKDVSRQNRYHNRKFKATCEEMGLSWEHLQYVEVKDEEGNLSLEVNPDFDKSEPADIRKNPMYRTRTADADERIGFSDMTITRATARRYAETVARLDADVQVQLASDRLGARPVKHRRSVLILEGSSSTTSGLVSHEEYAEYREGVMEMLAETERQEDDIDPEFRMGLKVYESLARRALLRRHTATIVEATGD